MRYGTLHPSLPEKDPLSYWKNMKKGSSNLKYMKGKEKLFRFVQKTRTNVGDITYGLIK